MIRIVRFLVGLMALDPRGQRAIEAAFADWRHELTCAVTGRRRLGVNMRSTVGVARTLVNAGVAALPLAWRGPFVWKLAGLAVLWLIWMLKDGAPGSTDRFFLVTSQTKAWTLVAASLVPQLMLVLPLMVFFAEAMGRRRSTPVAGTAVLLAAVASIIGLVVWPASAVHLRYETWRYFANASVPEPKFGVLFLSTLSILPTVLAMAGVWLLFVFANRIRRVGGVTGWAIGLGTVLAAYFVGALATALAGATLRIPTLRYDIWIALMLSRPLWILAAILWATRRLARIEAGRSAAQLVVEPPNSK